MSRINTIRIVNLNYNNNTMKINDEIFDMAGESTLLSLQNGGGKTVLVQMMMAPFVNARYRDSKDRKFENYFKSNTPTYILVEWLLDNNSGYLLTGMGIKRKAASGLEDGREELELLTFIHEYKSGNEYDIHEFPITETTEKGFKVKSLSGVRTILDELKSNKNYIFNYFELGIDSHRKKYFDTLKQYGINHSEWESIVKKINQKESGLSDLFQETKTINGLVEKWFLPTVAEKLKDNEDKIKNFQEIMQKFIYQYKENENKIIRRQDIQEFKPHSSALLAAAEDFNNARLNTGNIKNNLANLYNYISSSIDELLAEKDNIKQQLEALKEEMDEIQFERLSFEYNQINEKLSAMKEEEQDTDKIIKGLEREADGHTREINLQECAWLYQDYIEQRQQVQTYEHKLDIARSSDSENELERNNLGYTLRSLYAEIVCEDKEKVELKNNEIISIESHIKNLDTGYNQLERKYNHLTRECAELNTKVEAYSHKENSFNRKFSRTLKRNVMGEYDEVIIASYEKDYEDRSSRSNQLLAHIIKEAAKEAKELKNLRNSQNEMQIEEIKLNAELNNKNNELAVLRGKTEEIKRLLLYSNIDDSKLYEKEYILRHISRRLQDLNNEKGVLQQQLDHMEKEKRMYETGRNIKLSPEIRERLEALDIDLVFGMEWLKKQALSMERKDELIKRNPFLPYSLIMTKYNIDKLKKGDGKVFTSFPLPILEREQLDESLDFSVVNDVYTISGMNFLIAFNNKLLNQEELNRLIREMEYSIEKLKDQIETKDREIEEFLRHKQKVEEFNVNKSDLKNLDNEIKNLENHIKRTSEHIIAFSDKIKSLEEKIIENQGLIKNTEQLQQFLQQEKEAYEELKGAYKDYMNQNSILALKREEKKAIGAEKEDNKEQTSKERSLLDKLKEQQSELRSKLRNNEGKAENYSSFKEGALIDKDREDLESRYDALSSMLGAEVRELEGFLRNTMIIFRKAEKKLLEKADEYELKEDDYREISYDSIKEKTFKEKRQQISQQIRQNAEQLKNLQLDIVRKEGEKDNKLRDIKKLNRETAKENIFITNLNFAAREEIKSKEINECGNAIEKISGIIGSLESSRDKMDEYSHFKPSEEKELDIPYHDVENVRKSLREDYLKSKAEEVEKEEALEELCSNLSREDRFNSDEFFRNTIGILMEIKGNPEDVIKTLEIVNEVHQRMLEQLETDLERVEEEKKNIIEMFYEFTLQIYEHLGRIDDNSSININGKHVKMLEIIQPKWEEKEDYYRLQIKELVENITESCLEELYQGKNIEETISREITTNRLYDNVVGISEIDIKLYKVEASKQVKISWNQVSENSGGEGFLSAFVILTSLLSYMRKDENDIFRTSRQGKVLIMDNPFAQTNAEHLLKPLMEIAKKNNTQLICFTGLGGDSIYNRFDNIYVLNLIESKLKPGMQFMESEHKKGEELTHLTSSRFKIEEEKAEQTMLF